MKTSYIPWLMMFPALFLIFSFFLYPAFYSVYLSFLDAHLKEAETFYQFVGLRNYQRIFEDPVFYESLRTTSIYSALRIPMIMLFSLGIALVLNEEFRGKRIIRVIFLIPWAIPPIVNGMIWKWIYDAEFGLLNAVLKQFGLIRTYQLWLADPMPALGCLLIAELWRSFPFVSLVLLASLQTVPQDLYEASRIDGASAWQRFRYVTFPSIFPTFIAMLILQMMWAFQAFTVVYTITKGGPGHATELFSFHIYLYGFTQLRMGYASAEANILFLIILVLTIIFLRLSKIEFGKAQG